MRIRNQVWIDTETHLVITLWQPYWGAWKKYGWEQGVEGFGISKEAIEEAEKQDKKIRVNLMKYGSYEISPKKAKTYRKNTFIPRDGKPIYVIPRTAFDRINSEQKQKEYDRKEHLRAVKIAEAQMGMFPVSTVRL